MVRSFTYWPGVDKDIKNIAKFCEGCAKNANFPRKYSQHHWEYPIATWVRKHIEYAGPFQGKMLLIFTDAYFKWLELAVTKPITASATSALLDDLLRSFEYPRW